MVRKVWARLERMPFVDKWLALIEDDLDRQEATRRSVVRVRVVGKVTTRKGL